MKNRHFSTILQSHISVRDLKQLGLHNLLIQLDMCMAKSAVSKVFEVYQG